MPTIYVARSAGLAKWGSDVGLSKHVYKLGLTDQPLKQHLTASAWAGFADWTIVLKQEEVTAPSEAEAIQSAARKVRMVDPALYPRLKGAMGVFKILPAQVENHIVLTRALAGLEESGDLKIKAADFARYLIHQALRGAPDPLS